MRVLLLLLVSAVGAFAQCAGAPCSAAIPTTSATATPNFGNLGGTSFQVIFRLTNIDWTNSNTIGQFADSSYAAFGGMRPVHFGFLSGSLTCGGPDTYAEDCLITYNTSATDITVRLTRNVGAMTFTFEAQNTETGVALFSPQTRVISSLASNATITANGIAVGMANADGRIAFMRASTTLATIGTTIPIADYGGWDLGNWEFTNNGNDSSGLGQTISGLSTYYGTPTYSPSCSAGTPRTVRLGQTITLDGSGSQPLDGGTSLTYSWSYITGLDGVDQGATLTGGTTATPTSSALNEFGSANFELTVSDSSMNSSTCEVHNGVVPFDAGTGVVDLDAVGLTSAQKTLAGNALIAYGQNPWEWADDRTWAQLELQACNIGRSWSTTACSDPGVYAPYWRDFKAGTISFSSGSTTVTGSGTSLQTLACAGGSSPSSGAQLIWRYTGTDGETHYTYQDIAGCTSETSITLAHAYPSSPIAPWPSAPSGVSFTIVLGNDATGNTWWYNSAPGNYYDNVLAGWTLYKRSGIDLAWDFATELSQLWRENPRLDYFLNCDDFSNNVNPSGSACVSEMRSASALGQFMMEQESGGSILLPGLQALCNHNEYMLSLFSANGFDPREAGYNLAFISACALVDPSPSTWQTDIQDALAFFTSIRDDHDSFPFFSYSWAHSSISTGGSVSVTNGSTAVVGSGTNFSGDMVGNAFLTWGGTLGTFPADNSAVDTTPRYITAVADSTHLTLSGNYTGTTASGRNWTMGGFSGLVGWGIQPYMEALLGQAMGYAAAALDRNAFDGTGADLYETYQEGLALMLVNDAITPDRGGFYNGLYFPNCDVPMYENASAPQLYCYGATDFVTNGGTAAAHSQLRILSMESMTLMAQVYQRTQNATIKTAADTLMDQQFCPSMGYDCVGSSDGYWIDQYDPGGDFMINTPPAGQQPKWFGELAGFANAVGTWPAARLSTPAGAGSPFGGRVVISGKVRF